MQHRVDQMVLRAKIKALQARKDFLEKWKNDPAALPSQVAASLQQEQQQQGFNQANNPAQGGLSPEGVTPGVSDRVTVTGVDKAGLEVQ